MKTLSLRRCIGFVLAAFVMVIAFALFSTDTYAAVSYKIDVPATQYHSKTFDESHVVWIKIDQPYYDDEGHYIEDIAPIKAKSSNPKVIKVVNNGGDYEMILKKSGKARITATFKDKDGNKRTISKLFRVKKYPTFIKSLRVNGKKMNLKEDMFNSEVYTTKKKTTARINLTLKKGYKKNDILGYYLTKGGRQIEMPESELKKVLRGKKFKFPKKYKSMYVSIEIGKTGDYRSYLIDIKRK